ncbi:WD repeat-containing protein 53 [Hydra vulgaris]|uniref:WD repeat-containing protein 53 n=1 Tax=Hydra vulgaris TaxID=6087 RepID=T2MA36_HYDVU|nr:WD repeat-containing protein 53 [Hydra vulgaris]
MAARSDKTLLKFSNFNLLKPPSDINENASNLCAKIFPSKKIVVGNECGCFVLPLGESMIYDQVGLLKNKEVTSISNIDENSFYAASGNFVYLFDLRLNLDKYVHFYCENDDEINQIQVNNELLNLACCDDSGEVKIFDLKVNKLFKTLRRRHKNICSCINFISNKQNEIVTGGMDSQIIRWNFHQVKPLQIVNTQDILKETGDHSVYMFNPPLIFSMDVSKDSNFLASGLGNGAIQIFQLMRGSLGMKPCYVINKHSSLGVPCVQFLPLLDNSTQMLLSGGNDGYLHLWNISSNNTANNLKQKFPKNRVCLEDELKTILLDSLHIDSKLSSIDSAVIDGKYFVVFTDQTASVKLLDIEY